MADRVKDRVRDHFEQKIDGLHRIADVVTFPFAPIDGAIHGIARGALNWLTDTHPEERSKSYGQKCISPQTPPTYGYAPPPLPRPPYYPNPPQQGHGYPYPRYSYYNTGSHHDTGNYNQSYGQTNHGAFKFQ